MRKLFVLAAALFLLTASVSCTDNGGPDEPHTSGITPSAPAPGASLSRYTEEEEQVLRIMSAGRQFAGELKAGQQPSNARDEQENEAVPAFERFFKTDTLYVSGAFMDPYMPEYYTCFISGDKGYGGEGTVRVYFSRSEPMTWSCPLVSYGHMIDGVTESYMGFIWDNDPEGLARWLLVDGEPGTQDIERAEKAIVHYRGYLDLSSYSIREYDLLDEGFLLTIEDANGITFQTELHYGDGLCLPRLPDERELE